jgi:hypothetical protein
VQSLERFEPTAEEVERAAEEAAKKLSVPNVLRLRLDAGMLPPTALSELKDVLAGFPGEAEVLIELKTSVGPRRLRLGSEFRVARGAALHAELDELFGPALLGEEMPRGASEKSVPVAISA